MVESIGNRWLRTVVRMFVVVVRGKCVNTHIYTQADKQRGADIAEPLLKRTQSIRQIANANGTIADYPCNHDHRQSRTQSEYKRHKPRPCYGLRYRHVYHSNEIH